MPYILIIFYNHCIIHFYVLPQFSHSFPTFPTTYKNVHLIMFLISKNKFLNKLFCFHAMYDIININKKFVNNYQKKFFFIKLFI